MNGSGNSWIVSSISHFAKGFLISSAACGIGGAAGSLLGRKKQALVALGMMAASGVTGVLPQLETVSKAGIIFASAVQSSLVNAQSWDEEDEGFRTGLDRVEWTAAGVVGGSLAAAITAALVDPRLAPFVGSLISARVIAYGKSDRNLLFG